jgi:hypothetical protein
MSDLKFKIGDEVRFRTDVNHYVVKEVRENIWGNTYVLHLDGFPAGVHVETDLTLASETFQVGEEVIFHDEFHVIISENWNDGRLLYRLSGKPDNYYYTFDKMKKKRERPKSLLHAMRRGIICKR